MKIKYFAYPVFLYSLSQVVYYLLPPIIDLDTLNINLWIYDFVALIVFLLLYSVFQLVIPTKKRPDFDKSSSYSVFIRYLVVLLGLIYFIRIVLIHKFGFLSLLHSYAYDGGLIAIVGSYVRSILIPFLMYGWIVFKKKIFILFFSIEMILFLSTLSKVSVLKIVIMYFVVSMLLGLVTKKILIKYVFFIFPFFIFLTIVFSSLTHVYRSIAVGSNVTIEAFNNVEAPPRDLSVVATNLLNRFNLHKNHSVMTGYEKVVVEREILSLEQLYLRMTLQSSKLNPTPYWAHDVFEYSSKTADVFPRNFILYEIGGWVLIILFVFFNALYILFVKIFSLNMTEKGIGISIYTSFVLSYLTGDGGSNPAVTIFDQTMFVISVFIIFIFFKIINFISKINNKKHRISH